MFLQGILCVFEPVWALQNSRLQKNQRSDPLLSGAGLALGINVQAYNYCK